MNCGCFHLNPLRSPTFLHRSNACFINLRASARDLDWEERSPLETWHETSGEQMNFSFLRERELWRADFCERTLFFVRELEADL